ncbi:MAG TPA: methyltransferase domain-containing protein [Candidatus Baltobacteraceae bacterium]|nr:methyltransferase domain-containing protein [Candidatus Baltobacteraceae bacterium]
MTGGILHDAAGYDFMMWLLHFGREYRFRADAIELASLVPGESVLDVGCGTGTLAIAAKRKVGKAGTVYGIDASREMLARARAKAKKQRADVAFENAAAEALPFPDARFDVVVSTIMLHHLPRKIRLEAAREIRRVLKPDGRVAIVDFQDSGKRGFFGHVRRHRHGHVKIDDMLALLDEAGLNVTQSGPFRKPNLYFVLAIKRTAAPDRS